MESGIYTVFGMNGKKILQTIAVLQLVLNTCSMELHMKETSE